VTEWGPAVIMLSGLMWSLSDTVIVAGAWLLGWLATRWWILLVGAVPIVGLASLVGLFIRGVTPGSGSPDHGIATQAVTLDAVATLVWTLVAYGFAAWARRPTSEPAGQRRDRVMGAAFGSLAGSVIGLLAQFIETMAAALDAPVIFVISTTKLLATLAGGLIGWLVMRREPIPLDIPPPRRR
jgi:hypothetical protein